MGKYDEVTVVRELCKNPAVTINGKVISIIKDTVFGVELIFLLNTVVTHLLKWIWMNNELLKLLNKKQEKLLKLLLEPKNVRAK